MNTLHKTSNASPDILLILLTLLHGWQNRNCSGPLRHLLRKWPPFTDDLHDYRELLFSLRNVRTQFKQTLSPRDLTYVDEITIHRLIHWLEKRTA